MSWQSEARCSGIDTSLFFDDATVDKAISVCAQCPVRFVCGRFARMHNEVHGVWGFDS